jgi:geranylgeranyl pyrophosphate synthase
MTQAFVPLERQELLLRQLEAEFRIDGLCENLGGSADAVPRELWERSLLGPLREFFGRPGKELRAALVTSAWQIAGGKGALPREAAMLVELLHGGSLIIDDIQDGSELRRGGTALHRVIGEPLAINTGNWLYFYAEELAGRLSLAPLAELELRRAVSSAVLRCHYGQALDLSARVGMLAQPQVATVVRATTELKTGSLFALAARVGAISAGASAELGAELAEFGQTLGVGLQMLDDLSGLCSPRLRHKGHEDLVNGRPTWLWAWLADEIDELGYTRLQHAVREVERGALSPDVVADALRERLSISGRARVHEHFARARERLRASAGPSAALRALELQVTRLEESYA